MNGFLFFFFSHKLLKVVELVGFTGFRKEVEFVLHLNGTSPLLEEIIIDDVHLPVNNLADIVCSSLKKLAL